MYWAIVVLGVAGCTGDAVRFHGGPSDVDAGDRVAEDAAIPSTSDAAVASTKDADVVWPSPDAAEPLDGTPLAGWDAAANSAPSGDIVFTGYPDFQIYTVNVDGSARTQLTSTGTNVRPVWSPDGRKIAFVRYTTNHFTGDVYIMDEDGSNVVRRTTGGLYGSVAWSPDGTKLAVSTENLYYSDIWVISASDDGASPLLVAPDARTPAWSPDSKKIAFVRVSHDDGYELMGTVNADGTGESLITDIPSSYDGLDWSKQDRLVWSRGGTLNTSNPDGSDVTPVMTTNVRILASWSPDGERLVLSLWTCDASCPPATDPRLALMSSTGGATSLVTTDGFRPHWKP